MNKYTDRILLIILGLLTPFMILIILFILLYFIPFIKREFASAWYLSIAISFLIGIFLRKIRFLSIPLFIATLSLLVFTGYREYNKKHKKNILLNHTTNWKNPEHSSSIPFFVHSSGHIYIKTELLGEKKYLVFDTGADNCALNEKYNTSNILKTSNITDSQAKKNKVQYFTLDSLSLGELNFKQLSYGSLKKKIWGSKCGIFYKQDSVAGILGNNVINNFVWDIDMIKHTMQISDQPFKEKTTSAKVVPLINIGMGWNVEIQIDGKLKKVKLDSGSNGILSLKDSIHFPKTYTNLISKVSKSKGIFSYMDCDGNEIKIDTTESSINKRNISRRVFADLYIADTIYKNTLVSDNKPIDLIGIPIFWEYERVVLDFLSKKMYLINPTKSKNSFQLSKKSINGRSAMKIESIKKNGYFESSFNKVLLINTQSKKTKDTVIFKFIGKMKCYAHQINSKSIKMDSIIGMGTVLNTSIAGPINLKLNDFKPLNYTKLWNDL